MKNTLITKKKNFNIKVLKKLSTLENYKYSENSEQPSIYGYQSLYKQLQRIIDRIFNPNSKFHYFVDKVSDEVLLDIVFAYALNITNPKERNIKSGVDKYKGMRYNLGFFSLGNLSTPFNEIAEKYKIFLSTHKEKYTDLQEFYNEYDSKINPLTYLDLFEKNISKISYYGVSPVINGIINAINDIYNNLFFEKEQARKKGLYSAYYLRCSQFYQFSLGIIYDIIFFLFTTNHLTEQKNKSLDEIYFTLNDWLDSLTKLWNQYFKVRPFEEILLSDEDEDEDRRINGITQTFALYLQCSAANEEMKIIQDTLIEDMENHKDFFHMQNPMKHQKINEYTSRADFIKDIKQSSKKISKNDYKKLDTAIDVIKKMNLEGLADENKVCNDAYLVKLVYRHFLLHKVKIKRKRSKNSFTIIQDWIDYNQIENTDYLFLESILLRGKFCEAGKANQYYNFCQIIQKSSNYLLNVWDLSNDVDMYNFIYNFLKSFLHIINQ